MKRTRNDRTTPTTEPADAILTADWHLRPDQPVARTDDFWLAIAEKVCFILDLAKENGCPILLAGDLGHRPGVRNWPFWLLYWCMANLGRAPLFVTPGQHDLPNHQIDLVDESGLGILHLSGCVTTILGRFRAGDPDRQRFSVYPFHWNKPVRKPSDSGAPNIAMAHTMVIENKPLWPGQEAPRGHELLEQFPEYSVILTGDNHNPFTAQVDGRWLVNPGSLARTAANQIDHKPRVYLWWARGNRVEPVFLPIQPDVLDRTHIEKRRSRDDRFTAFVAQTKKIEEQGEVGLSFEDNMEAVLAKTRLRERTVEKIYEAMV